MFEIYLKYKDNKARAPEKVKRYVEIVDKAIKALVKENFKASRVFDLQMKEMSVRGISNVLEISIPQVSRYLAEANTFLKKYISESTQSNNKEV